jgi:glucokinase
MAVPALVIDVGATTSRFALGRAGGSLETVRSISNREVKDIATVLEAALDGCGRVRPLICVLAVAAPVDGDFVTMTNRKWSFSQRELRAALKLKRLVVINDFVATAHALPHVRQADLVAVGGGRSTPKATMLVCGPGTGFGAAVLQRDGARPRAVASEAGHMRLGAATADEARVLAHLVREEGPVAVEQILSGPGLVRLHRILAGETLSSEEIIASARLGRNAARDTVHAFLRLFGRIAGDLALAFDARGGVFIAGGIGRVLAPFYASSPFRGVFEEHPPYQARLASIPVNVIAHAAPGLLGAARIAASLKRR